MAKAEGVAKSPSEAKKKLRPSKVKSLAKYEAKKKARAAGTLKKKPKKSLTSGTATWKVVYKSGTWRFIHKPTEDKLIAKAKAEGKPIETPVKLFFVLFVIFLLFIIYFNVFRKRRSPSLLSQSRGKRMVKLGKYTLLNAKHTTQH